MADIKRLFSRGITILYIKTVNFLERNKLITYIETLNSEIEELKAEAGNIVYTTWNKDGEINTEELEDILRQIKEKVNLVTEQEKELANLSEKEIQILGEPKPKKTKEVPDLPSEPILKCPGCGETYEDPDRFCRKCGSQMN